MTEPLLEIRDLSVSFRSGPKAAPIYRRAVESVSISVPARAAVGIVGESGSGKSVTALSVLRLLPEPPSQIDRGELWFRGRPRSDLLDMLPVADPEVGIDLRRLSLPDLRRFRGSRIAMIFQEPMTALNPVYSIGEQIGEALRAHLPVSRREGLSRAAELLARVGIPDASKRIKDYPHQLSGGQRQRVMIAMALSCEPELLIADEPTTALDVTTQAQILELFRRLQGELGMSVLLISHDLGVISEVCQAVAVMYAGQVVENAPAAELFTQPRHPYTAGLLSALPRLGAQRTRLREIPGRVPSLDEMPSGCRFAPRCPLVQPRCRSEAPELRAIGGPEHAVRCHFPLDGERVYPVSGSFPGLVPAPTPATTSEPS